MDDVLQMCKGRGAYDSVNNTQYRTAQYAIRKVPFMGNGQCASNNVKVVSAYNTDSQGWISCSTCNGTDAVQGYNLDECSANAKGVALSYANTKDVFRVCYVWALCV